MPRPRHLISRRRKRTPRRFRALLDERLEPRRVLASFTVVTSSDTDHEIPPIGTECETSNDRTLRGAIERANRCAGHDEIRFALPGEGPHVIRLESPLPVISDEITIDGFSQPGATANTNSFGQEMNSRVLVELDGGRLSPGANGLEISAGNSIVAGLAIHSFRQLDKPPEEILGVSVDGDGGFGILLTGGGGNAIVGNYLGLTAEKFPLGNTTGIGVGSSNNMIQGNVVSWNRSSGISIGLVTAGAPAPNVSGNAITGNYVGTGADGLTAMGNRTGISIALGARGNRIGVPDQAGNLISGNQVTGISIVGTAPGGASVGENRIQANLIGTDRTGRIVDPDGAAGNGDELGNAHTGIQILDSPDNVVGGSGDGAANLISGNGTGALIVGQRSTNNQLTSNRIGSDRDGQSALGNLINGVELQNAGGNYVRSNLLSGNVNSGVYVTGDKAEGNFIDGNRIGVDLSGARPLPNSINGVTIHDAPRNIVSANTVSANRQAGVLIDGAGAQENQITNNVIGTDTTGDAALGNDGMGIAVFGAGGNSINNNTISANQLGGIYIAGAAAIGNVVHSNRIGTDRSGSRELGNKFDGILIQDAVGNLIGSVDSAERNVISGNGRDGIRVTGRSADQNQIFGNHIGTDNGGMQALANGGSGVHIVNGSMNVVGGNTADRRNVISGNLTNGVEVSGTDASGNRVLGNYIGTDKDGTRALGNARDGVLIVDSSDNQVGSMASTIGDAPGNVISGNVRSGVVVRGGFAIDNKIQGNLIGLDKSKSELGNLDHGVWIDSAEQNLVGEPATASGPTGNTGNSNIIAHNRLDGVRISGGATAGNLVRRNEIHDNGRLGINLVGGDEHLRRNNDGVTPNDYRDGDGGANGLMNFPVGVTAWFDARNNRTYVSGVLDSLHPDTATIDIYASDKVDDSGFGEGRYYLGSTMPDRTGAFLLTFPNSTIHIFLSATATDSGRSTSEFSPVYGDPDGDKFIDTDGDGLPDEWETRGIDYDGDDVIDLDLKALGADPRYKDVIVEFDYAVVAGMRIRQKSIDAVKSAFRRAPVDGHLPKTGINLIINKVRDADRITDGPFQVAFEEKPGLNDDFWDLKRSYLGTADERRRENRYEIQGARALATHYTLFVGQVAPKHSPGAGEVSGDDFINEYDTSWNVEAAALMHELGHNLGLDHGGPVSTDTAANKQSELNYKPNHLSVMNYAYIYSDLVNRPLDFSPYSSTTLHVLDENNLDESRGIAVGLSVPGLERWRQVEYTYPLGAKAVGTTAASTGAIDWNHNLTTDLPGIVANINDDPDGNVTNNLNVLQSRDEWRNLHFDFRATRGSFTGLRTRPNSDERSSILRAFDTDQDGISNDRDNAPFAFNPLQEDSDDDGIGDAGELRSLVLDNSSVSGGATVTGSVTLLLPAPAEGARVELFTSDPYLIDLPESVVIPAGETTGIFEFTTSSPTTIKHVTVYAALFSNDTAETDVAISPGDVRSDVSVSQSVEMEPVSLGQPFDYQVVITNVGTEPVAGVELTDTLSAGQRLLDVRAQDDSIDLGPGLHVRFDYSRDTENFFDTQEKKDLLRLAADAIVGPMGDDLEAIAPGDGETWTAVFVDPATGQEVGVENLVVNENELVIFVGGRELIPEGADGKRGLGGPGSTSASGSEEFLRTVSTRGESGADDSVPTDFGPWGGSIAFDTGPTTEFHFGETTEGLDPDEIDFLTTAMHEIAHVLGYGSAPSWTAWVDAQQGVFTGEAARAEFESGGDVPLSPGLDHWAQGTRDDGQPTLMDTAAQIGTRELLTPLDLAALDDIGWNTDGRLHVERQLPFTEIGGVITVDVGALDPGDSAEVIIRVLPTSGGAITNVVEVTSDYLIDTDPENNRDSLTIDVPPTSAIVVDTIADIDDGTHTSLRMAIQRANSLPGIDTIAFDLPGPGPHSIRPASALPEIIDPIVIDGSTEPDFEGTPVVEIDGSLVPAGANGLHVAGGGSTIRYLVVNRFAAADAEFGVIGGNGILLDGGADNVVEHNYLGTDTTGTLALGNGQAGVGVYWSDGNTIRHNVASGNEFAGVALGWSNSNVVQSNIVGLDVLGQNPLGNGIGVQDHAGSNNLIGGDATDQRNIVSGNLRAGIEINPSIFSGGNVVQGNYVGTNIDGDVAVGNESGIVIRGQASSGQLVVGGTSEDAGNLVSGNRLHGIVAGLDSSAPGNVMHGNLVGTAANGTDPLGNGANGVYGRGLIVGGVEPGQGNVIAYNGGAGIQAPTFAVIRGNSIHSNESLGIDLAEAGVSPNDPEDMDYEVHFALGLQHLQNRPVLHNVYSGAGRTTLEGVLPGPRRAISLGSPIGVVHVRPLPIALDFYYGFECDPSGHGEGRTYIGSGTVVNGSVGAFTTILPVEIPDGALVTVTATQPVLDGNTSEFSACAVAHRESDGDGVSDEVEDAGPNGGDANRDGTPDRLQREVASLPNSTDGRYVLLESSAEVSFRDVRAIDSPSPQDGPPGVTYDVGHFEFGLIGDSGTVTVIPPPDVALSGVYNFGLTEDRPFDHWYQLPTVEVQDDRIVLTLTDGDTLGDHDLTRDNQITTRISPVSFPPDAGTTIVVNSVDDVDDGQANQQHTSLREAIQLANFLPGKDLIAFDIPGQGPHTIRPTSELPEILDALTIDGYTAPGARPAMGDEPAVMMVEVDGSQVPTPATGLTLIADDNTIRGIVVNRFLSDPVGREGIQLAIRSSGNAIEGNYVGTDVSGTVSYFQSGFANVQRYGILMADDRGIDQPVMDNTIGGTTSDARNVISGLAGAGIYVFGTRGTETARTARNEIKGNYVGTDAGGTESLGNGSGIWFSSGTYDNLVGGFEPGSRNVISGNVFNGIQVTFGGEHRILGNYIGTDFTGTESLANQRHGIAVEETSGNMIGGVAPEARNVISANAGNGVTLAAGEGASFETTVQGNFIGTDVSGLQALGNLGAGVAIGDSYDNLIGGTESGAGNVIAFNGQQGVVAGGFCQLGVPNCPSGHAILGNSIFANGQLGIDLIGDGVTPNFPPDGRPRPEPEFLSFDVDTSGGQLNARGQVLGAPNSRYEVRLVFSGGSAGIWGILVVTDENGFAEFDRVSPGTGELASAVILDLDRPVGPNRLQNYPLLDNARLDGSNVAIDGRLSSTPDTTFRLEFFASEQADESDHGEGRHFLGAADVVTDSDGIAEFNVVLTGARYGELLTSTATDPEGNTSEFSAALAVVQTGGGLDFGDAPAGALATTLSTDGARHAIVEGFHLGATVDAEEDGQPSDLADGDDNDDGDDEDDEDGIDFVTPLTPGRRTRAWATASGDGYLDAWFDFNRDGDWMDTGEQVLVSLPVSSGLNALVIDVPADAALGTTFARFRFSSAGRLGFDGVAPDGEVEDYAVLIEATTDPRDPRPPAATDDSATTPQGRAVVIDVVANDSDPDGDIVTTSAVVAESPNRGRAVADPATGLVLYVPEPEFVGTDSFKYQIRDGRGARAIATVSVVVTPGNAPPVARDDSAESDEDTPIVIDVLSNDSDPEDALLPGSLVVRDFPAHGTVTVDRPGGTVTYRPDPDFAGLDSFVYRVSDDQGAADTARVEVTVTATNDSPVIADDAATTEQETEVAIDVLANDFDSDDDLDSTTLEIVVVPDSGVVTVDPTGIVRYVPDGGFHGRDGFTYRVADSFGASGTGRVVVDVSPSEHGPIAGDDFAMTDSRSSVVVDVVANDRDADDDLDPRSVRLVTSPTGGTVSIDPDSGAMTYTPDMSGAELVMFSYAVSDMRGNTDEGMVIVTVSTTGPVADAGGPYTVDEGSDVVLDASQSSVTDLAVARFDWDLDNDGQYDDATGLTATFRSIADGAFAVGLRVTDDEETSTDVASVVVRNVAPTADAGGPYHARVDAEIVLDASGSSDPGQDIVRYDWDLDGDGQFDDASGVTIVFRSAVEGTRAVLVKVTDEDGADDVASAAVSVTASSDSLVIDAATGGIACVAQVFEVVAPFSTTAEVSYEIDYDGDGLPDETVVSSAVFSWEYVFGTSGRHTVNVTATDATTGETASGTVIVELNAAGMIGPDIYACGDASANRISASLQSWDQLNVRIDNAYHGPFRPGEGGRLFVLGAEGNDMITVAGNVPIGAVLLGGPGRDYLAGSRRDDTLFGGDGNDKLLGGEGNNVLHGDGGNDQLIGRDGDERMFGGGGNDLIIGDAGNDLLEGGSGNDQIVAGEGADVVRGGTGNDVLDGQQDGDVVVGGGGRDRIRGSGGHDLLIGGADKDQVDGGRGDDLLIAAGTLHDDDDAALLAILAEWTEGPRTIDQRVERLTDPAFAAPLNADTVWDDQDIDKLFGRGGEDWSLMFGDDLFRDRADKDRSSLLD